MTLQLGLGLVDPGASALWTRDDGSFLDPRTDADWRDWVAAGATRAWCLGDPLLDWLERYGESRGFARDDADPGYDPAFDLRRFLADQGGRFEAKVLADIAARHGLTRIGRGSADARSLDAARETWEAMRLGVPAIAQAVLRDPQARLYGKVDLLVRADVLRALCPSALEGEDELVAAPALPDASWHYRAVDVKFSTVELLKDGALSPSSDLDDMAQLWAYAHMLGRIQGYTPPFSYVLGRGWKQGRERGDSCWERLARIPQDLFVKRRQSDLAELVRDATEWIRRVRREGARWDVLPAPTVAELWPNMKNQADFPWHRAKRRIAEELGDLTLIWHVSPRVRERAHAAGVTRWDDPRLDAALLGIESERTAGTIDAILAVNRDGGPPVRPERVRADGEAWRVRAEAECYVDFETVGDLADDFAGFPRKGGQTLIFQVGCGRWEEGRWRFEQFTVEQLGVAAEGEMIDRWIGHLADLARAAGVDLERVRLFHWSPAETSFLEGAYNAARTRHPERGWPDLGWYDVLDRVVRAEPVVVRGARGFGLKAVANALRSHGLIETDWGEGLADGSGAMAGAWSAQAEASRLGVALPAAPLMVEIARYNEVDCRVMAETLAYLRERH
ncbi:MAG TPA: hypothetical protein VMJ92_05715 [Candidatus Limnocylindrales bacterium]|nr:hypothetical protein [Candidatus Limnocylindrales bacterium]